MAAHRLLNMSYDLTQRVKQFALDQGASLVGIADAELMDRAPVGHRSRDILKDARSLVVIATPQARAIIRYAPPTEYTRSIFSCETKLEVISHNIANYLDGIGFDAIPIPVRSSLMMDNENLMGDISHKHAAVLAGLGYMGKSSLVITPRYGNRCYFSSIVTNAPLEPDEPFEEDLCKDCVACIKACPVKAISDSGAVDKELCYDYCRTKRDEYPLTQGLYTCRECRRVCPYSILPVRMPYSSVGMN